MKVPLQRDKVVAIVPAPIILTEQKNRAPRRRSRIRGWVRLILVLVAGGLVAVFAIAAWLNPYKDGEVWLEETHTQMGFPRCTFKKITGVPCPSCGMTSSFSLLIHGDPWNSLRANFVGTLLAVFLLVLAPWSLLSALWGRWLWVRDVEQALVRVVVVFVVLLFLRWGLVLSLQLLG